ncbi:MAG TPA: ATP-binding protein, partial [Ruminococcaceae bacterium]|nr:ATP-binding protein [Oscillospiraceae bacterium]
LGIVENMSWFECDECHKKHYIFGDSHIDDIAAKHGIKNVARLPINPSFAQLGDSGNIESVPDVLGEFAAKVLG